jgi:hypothetical protein
MALAQPPPNKPSPPPPGLTFALQALLSRHESYIASSEAERAALTAQISRLESDKSSLERKNADIVRENHELLDHLEGLNNTIADSDAHITSLAATLAEAQLEVKRLMALAARTEELERQLEEMEIGRVGLEREVKQREEAERSAMWRWKEAEARVRGMNEQVERIEMEARLERERHVELVGRMERRRVVERELELERAAGRLKGAAALAKKEGDGGGRSNVVSHFVRDILQDNANLQAGIVELRELLQGSNEEVQNLRELVLIHQPVGPTGPGEGQDGSEAQQTTPLNEELEWVTAPKQVAQEVHVHHHYHAKFSMKKERAPLTRKTNKKRAGLGPGPGLLTPTPGSPTLRTASSRHSNQSSPLSASVGLPIAYAPPKKGRWSMQSAATGSSTMSSLPNSPHSYFDHRNSSIFDRIDPMSESSRPTSPESGGFVTPQFGSTHQKGKVSEFSLSAFAELPEDAESAIQSSAKRILRPPDDDNPLALPPEQPGPDYGNNIEDEGLDPLDISKPTNSAPRSGTAEQCAECQQSNHESGSEMGQELDSCREEPQREPLLIQPSLRRSASHESFISVSGMDIHIPKNSSSQIYALGGGFSPSPLTPSRTLPSSRPLASIVQVNANSSNLRSTSGSASASSISMLSGLATAGSSSSPKPSSSARGEWQGSLGRLVGEWVRGKWSIAPMASTGNLQEQAAASPNSNTNPFAARPPGINQKGFIPGLRPPVKTPSEVHARVVNEGLLRESLAE